MMLGFSFEFSVKVQLLIVNVQLQQMFLENKMQETNFGVN
jgi:hypothetical protein